MVVQRAELGEARVGLLEVIAQDLLVLDGSVAVLVHAVGPADEAFVEKCAGGLEEPPVGRVADQDVAEAIPPLQGEVSLLEPDEPFLHQRFEELGDALSDALGDQLLQGVLDELLPDHARRLDDLPLLGAEALQARGKKRMNRRRHRDGREIARGDPGLTGTAEETFLDHHLDQLLDEQRIPLRGRGDPCADFLNDPRLAEQLFDDPADLGFTKRLERDSDPVGLLTPVLSELEELGSRKAHEQ